MIRKVKTENGWVRGLPAADPRITSYKGIPYAAPPVGDNRWRAPQPCADWDGELFAADFGPAALQGNAAFNKDLIYSREWSVDTEQPMSEDCLYLNVWAPADGREKMPVYFWIYGGGLQTGFTAEMEMDGERIARRGIVVVTVGYRLNAFGFLCHPEITAESPDAPANFGLLDQQFALKWVKRNIAAFGGDPDNITIGGQSAGGMSVSAQILNPENKGLFKGAIIQSGCFAPPYPFEFGLCHTLGDAEKMGADFFKNKLGVSSLAEARKIDAQKILDAALSLDNFFTFGEAIDGRFAKHNAQDWYLYKDRVHCPVLMGSTSSEFPAEVNANESSALSGFAHATYGDKAEEFLGYFSKPMTAESIKKDSTINSIGFAVLTAQRFKAEKGTPEDKYYGYIFDADIPGWDDPGTFHSVDLWFFFETLAKCWRPFVGRHYDLARQMCDYWANFIKTGDPNGEDLGGEKLPRWDEMAGDTPAIMTFSDTSRPGKADVSGLTGFLLDRYFETHKKED